MSDIRTSGRGTYKKELFPKSRRLGCCACCLLGLFGLTTALLAQSSNPSKSSGANVGGSVPDISGIWMSTPPRRVGGPNDSLLDPPDKRKPDSAAVVPFLPEAEARYKSANEADSPSTRCLPPGISGLMLAPIYPMAILQTPGRVVVIHEFMNTVRWIYTDGQGHPKDLDPTWLGNSVGKWEGDTLVVDTIGFNDKSWLDLHGMTHSDELHTVERFHRRGAVLEYSLTIEDPKTFSRPWTVHMDYEFKPDWKIAEYLCAENNKDAK
jgi:hypothetical protein